MKRILCALLCLSLLCGAVPAFAAGETEIGTLGNSRRAYTVTCTVPKQYSLLKKQPNNTTLECMLANSSPTKTSYLFAISVDDDFADVESLADLDEETLSEMEKTYQEQGLAVVYKTSKNGMKFMCLKESDSKKNVFPSLETVYQGCYIQLTLSAVEGEISPMTEKQAQTAIDFLATLVFTPADPLPDEETNDDEEEAVTADEETPAEIIEETPAESAEETPAETAEETEALPEAEEENAEPAQEAQAQPEKEEATAETLTLTGDWTVYREPLQSLLTDEQKQLFASAADPIGMDYEPVAVVATQVVSGRNFAFLCRQPGEEGEWIIVTVYSSLDGKQEVLGAHVLALYNLETLVEAPEYNGLPVPGGWSVWRPEDGAALPEDVQSIVDKAIAGAKLNLSPIALLATQVVAGVNYKVLCAGNNNALYVLDVYSPLTGNPVVLNLEILDLLSYVGA